jgi:itaconate CoA-transferase
MTAPKGRGGLATARGRWRPDRTAGGDIDALLPPVQIDGQQPVKGSVPRLGEHTKAIRAKFGAEMDEELPA